MRAACLSRYNNPQWAYQEIGNWIAAGRSGVDFTGSGTTVNSFAVLGCAGPALEPIHLLLDQGAGCGFNHLEYSCLYVTRKFLGKRAGRAAPLCRQ